MLQSKLFLVACQFLSCDTFTSGNIQVIYEYNEKTLFQYQLGKEKAGSVDYFALVSK